MTSQAASQSQPPTLPKGKPLTGLPLLGALLVVLAVVTFLLVRYLLRPAPLPQLISSELGLDIPPHYLFSVYQVNQPIAVAVSPGGERLFVAESGGERLVRIFDRQGNPLGALEPQGASQGERAPAYMAVSPQGHVYVVDRLQHAIFIYSPEGHLLDALLSPTQALSTWISQQLSAYHPGAELSFDFYRERVRVQFPGEPAQDVPLPEGEAWSPLGVRFAPDGALYITSTGQPHQVIVLPGFSLPSSGGALPALAPMAAFGSSGQGDGQFMYPQVAVADAQGRVYVSDGNNARISTWDARQTFTYHFGAGNGDGSLSLPRGLAIDAYQRLYIVDNIGQVVHVYNLSGEEPAFLFSIGEPGSEDGLLNFPCDIALDDSGRVYIADRENNRLQIWSY